MMTEYRILDKTPVDLSNDIIKEYKTLGNYLIENIEHRLLERVPMEKFNKHIVYNIICNPRNHV